MAFIRKDKEVKDNKLHPAPGEAGGREGSGKSGAGGGGGEGGGGERGERGGGGGEGFVPDWSGASLSRGYHAVLMACLC